MPITHHLVYILVTRDLSCCYSNPILNRCLAKTRPKSESNLSRSYKITKKLGFELYICLQISFLLILSSCTKFELNSLRNNETTMKLLITDVLAVETK